MFDERAAEGALGQGFYRVRRQPEKRYGDKELPTQWNLSKLLPSGEKDKDIGKLSKRFVQLLSFPPARPLPHPPRRQPSRGRLRTPQEVG